MLPKKGPFKSHVVLITLCPNGCTFRVSCEFFNKLPVMTGYLRPISHKGPVRMIYVRFGGSETVLVLTGRFKVLYRGGSLLVGISFVTLNGVI